VTRVIAPFDCLLERQTSQTWFAPDVRPITRITAKEEKLPLLPVDILWTVELQAKRASSGPGVFTMTM
jgi:hypothetical protein